MGIDYRVLQVGPIESNCYVVWDVASKAAAVIDPGAEEDRIREAVDSLGVKVEWVLLTHGHFDHSFCAGPVAFSFGARIGMQALDVPVVVQSLAFAAPYYDPSEFVAFTPTDLLNDGDTIVLGSSPIGVLHTPGHSQGGLCFATKAGVFCGDTVFAGSVGRTDLPGGSHEQLLESIRAKILTLDDSTILLPGHGPGTTVGDERQYNWYLK